jgi:cytoskeletal protein CcmA (bactofilin family)
MVGKTPQVREIVYNVLDDDGNRTVIAKGATTVDVGDTKELFTRTSNLETLTSATFSNVSNAQNNIISIEAYLSQFTGSAYSPILLALQRDHTNNVTRIENLETDLASNAGIVSGNHSNIITLQTDVDENVIRIDNLVTDLGSNADILSSLKSAHESNALVVTGNYSNISTLQSQIQPALTALQEGQALQDDVDDLKSRITTTDNIIIGGASGEETIGSQSTIVGVASGRHIGDYSVALGYSTHNYQTEVLGSATDRSIVINATGIGLNAPRQGTLVVAPIQTDDSNTINIMGYNETTKEIVQSTLLRGIDGNVHATTNISVNNDTILFETNGNGSFGGNVEIAGTLEVGGSSSFTGAIQVDDTLEIADTSSFGGDMTIDANAFVYGQSFVVRNGPSDKIKLHNDGTGSFLSDVDIGGNLEVGGTSSFTGAMQVDNTLEIAGTSSFGGDMSVNANVLVTGQSFMIGSVAHINSSGNASFNGVINVDDINCNDTLDVFNSFRMVDNDIGNVILRKDGTSSFAGKMQINNALDVQGHSSFLGSVEVASGTASFGVPVVVNNTSSFTGVATFENNISVTGQSFQMGAVAHIDSLGNASFAEAITAKNINCDQILDVFDSFRMVDVSIEKVTINKDGASSFAGAMQINNTLDVDNTLTIKDGAETDGKVTINPGVNDETITVQGGIYVKNITDINAFITRAGDATFTSVTTPSIGNGTGSLSITSGVDCTANVSCTGEISASDFVIPSDRRFKSDIEHIPGALEKIKRLSGCTYTINGKPSVGVIAQEVLDVLPAAVHTRDDGYYGVSYHGLIGLLIEAVKELSEKVK